MIIRTKLEVKDIYNLGKESKVYKVIRVYIGLFLFVLMILFFANSGRPNNTPEYNMQSINTSVNAAPESKSYLPVIVFVSFIFLYFFGFRWSAKKQYKSNKLLQKELTYKITSDSIKQESESSSVTMKWDQFYKITENKRAFILFVSNLTAWVLPKRFFSEEELNRFRDLIKAVHPKKKGMSRD